jgi:hypothetical protein
MICQLLDFHTGPDLICPCLLRSGWAGSWETSIHPRPKLAEQVIVSPDVVLWVWPVKTRSVVLVSL